MKKIIHCDADCFFVALEIRDSPDLRGIPVAVGGDPGRRGVISTCNYEARAFGVKSAMPSAYAKRLCPQLIILPSQMTKYQEAALAMREIFLDYTSVIEPLSLDEAYLDVTESYHCLGSATLIAKDIRRRIHKEVGITVSAGISTNKFLAKVASDWQKPNGLTVITPERIQFFLRRLPVSAIPGVGPSSTKKLHSYGINTCYDLQQLKEAQLVTWFGKLGRHLYRVSRGDDSRPVKAREKRKSLSVERTFSNDIKSIGQCYPLLSDLAYNLSTRLEAVNSERNIDKCFVKVKFANFEKTTVEAKTRLFSLSLCNKLFHEAWQRYKQPVRLLGLGVRFKQSDDVLNQQLALF